MTTRNPLGDLIGRSARLDQIQDPAPQLSRTAEPHDVTAPRTGINVGIRLPRCAAPPFQVCRTAPGAPLCRVHVLYYGAASLNGCREE